MTGGTRAFAALALGALSLATAVAHPPAAQAQADGSSSTQIQDQSLPPPPGTNENTVLGPGVSGPAAGNPAAPPAPEAPSVAPAPSVAAPSQWLPQKQAQLTVLDKIYGSATRVSATVGAPFAVRFLTVTVLACWTRPPDLPPDTAAFLQVTDSHAAPGSPPEFRGWIFKAEPALSGMNDPVTDISLNGCG
ncbi:DUF2155 domain-containing protein [Acidisoma sp.]|uniref:DUF2155 domain-containing protein n=1 Tax=Acidisoma sp. TaxID=1872115 RepID=UPI003B0067FB